MLPAGTCEEIRHRARRAPNAALLPRMQAFEHERQEGTAKAVKRFWSKVNKSGPVVRIGLGRCWTWEASRFRSGYGQFSLYGEVTAHRVAWLLTKGPIPLDLWVLHRCDNRECVRPSHLFLGTAKDNSQDALKKGHLRSGLQHQNILITPSLIEVVERYRRLNPRASKSAISMHFKIERTSIFRILTKTSWFHKQQRAKQ